VAFTCIIHIIVLKLFLESVFWNYLSTLTGIACLAMYYGCVIGLNSVFVSQIIQPELTGEFYLIFQSVKAWLAIILLPMIALLPDITYVLVRKIFFPTPTDAIMLKQQRDPAYLYEGFDDVYIPQLTSLVYKSSIKSTEKVGQGSS
jgi:magnesium-transporting ATPase (P-type)